MKYELKEMNQGEIFSEAFNLYFDNFLALFCISIISALPGFLYTQSVINNTLSGFGTDTLARQILPMIFVTFANTIATALSIELLSKKYLRKPQSPGDYINNILPFIFPIILLSILQTLVVGIGFILFFIPGIIAAVALSMSSQALIIERTGAIDAMKRSWELSKGDRMQIFGFMFLMGIATIAADALLKFIILPIFSTGNLRDTLLLYSFASHLLSALITPITVCILILIYFNLRIKKEGFGLEHMVNQFSTASSEPTIEA